ncbi:hypothetical protein ACF8GB_19205 [Pseudomonas sp. xss_4]|uniref:hypothetical protein n=1 Tax=Pseudomonas sp. xss_4 TaxID=3367216 RepID=UPI00370C2EE7
MIFSFKGSSFSVSPANDMNQRIHPATLNYVYDELEDDLLAKFNENEYVIKKVDFDTNELKYFYEHKVSAIITKKDGIYEDGSILNHLGNATTEEITTHRNHIHYVKTVIEKKTKRR